MFKFFRIRTLICILDPRSRGQGKVGSYHMTSLRVRGLRACHSTNVVVRGGWTRSPHYFCWGMGRVGGYETEINGNSETNITSEAAMG